MVEGEYLYCIIKNNGSKLGEIEGIENGSKLYTINYSDLSAVVSKAPVKEYEATEENISRQRDVLTKILENQSVVPVAFGMVFKNRKIMLNIMRQVYALLKRSLNLVDNKIELGIKIILPKEGLDAALNKEDIVKDIVETLKKNSAQTKQNKLFSERLLLNASFLVERNKIGEFSEEVGKFGDKYSNLKIQYTGPWPAFSFVNINITGS